MAPRATRITTGVPGLDPIIEGGLLVGGVYMLVGPPGVGKTILVNQLCCHQARLGARAIYFTLLSESHAGMLEHLRRMEFFSEELIGDALVYFSGYKLLEAEGLAGLARLIGQTMVERGPSVVVLDGFAIVGEAAATPNDLKQFVRQLQAFSASVGCTTVLVSSASADLSAPRERAIVDGIIELSNDLSGLRSLRHLIVRKMRGSRPISGRHTMEITDSGMTVHARFEARSEGQDPSKRPRPLPRVRHGSPRAGFGIAELDAMMMGGPPRGSTTMVLGSSGVGKTTLALQFLAAGAEAGETGLFFGMYEQPEELLDKCGRIGIPLQDGIDAGKIHLLWERPIEGVLDVLADRLLARVRDVGATRLCIDGMHSLFRTVDFPGRMSAVSAALAEALTVLGLTTVYTLETPDLLGAELGPLRLPINDLSAMCQNLVAIRLIQREHRLDRMLAILKMRDSDYDRSVREMTITEGGVVVAPRLLTRARRPHRKGRTPE